MRVLTGYALIVLWISFIFDDDSTESQWFLAWARDLEFPFCDQTHIWYFVLQNTAEKWTGAGLRYFCCAIFLYARPQYSTYIQFQWQLGKNRCNFGWQMFEQTNSWKLHFKTLKTIFLYKLFLSVLIQGSYYFRCNKKCFREKRLRNRANNPIFHSWNLKKEKVTSVYVNYPQIYIRPAWFVVFSQNW